MKPFWQNYMKRMRSTAGELPAYGTLAGTERWPVVSGSGSESLGYATPATQATYQNTVLLTPALGVAAAGGFSASPRNWHTGGNPPNVSTDGTNLDIVITELYVAEVFVPCNATVTGVAVFNGAAVAGNIKVMIFDSAGTRVKISATTAASGTDAYQRVPFASTYAIVGPATYYIGVMGDNAGGDINTHVIGNFGAGKITGLVYATEAGYATITVPTTFTTGLGPIASLY